MAFAFQGLSNLITQQQQSGGTDPTTKTYAYDPFGQRLSLTDTPHRRRHRRHLLVLGLVTTKRGELESKDDLKRRIEEASRRARGPRRPRAVHAVHRHCTVTPMDATGQRDSGTALTGVPALDLGARLRAERLRQGMSLREMARRLGMSASALSQIETGKAQPSVSKLFDIVNLLSTSLDGLLAGGSARPAGTRGAMGGQGAARDVEGRDGEEREADGRNGHLAPPRGPEAEGFFSFQRSDEHDVLELDSGVQWRRLTAGSLPGVEFLHVTYSPGGCSSSEGAFMRHAGQEFGYVLSGLLVVEVGFDSYELTAGAAISFPATTPHRLSNPGSEPAHAIWLVLGRHAGGLDHTGARS